MKRHRIASLCLAIAAGIAHAQQVDRPFELKASASYSKDADRYLMVYSSIEASGGSVIYGRLLHSDGSPVGKDFRLSAQDGLLSKPVLAYNPKTQRFLVAWGRKKVEQDRATILARSVGADGAIAGDEFQLSSSDLLDTRPAIAYCPGRDRFLVAWTRGPEYDADQGISDIYGQFVEGNGSVPLGANFAIAAQAKNQFKPDVACDPVHDRFLVVWEDQRAASARDDVYGQLISSDGAAVGGNFRVAGTNNVERRPVVTANTKDGTYLVAWESVVDNRVRVFSQTLDTNGRPQREPVEHGTTLGGDRNRPAVSYLRQQNVFMVAFDNSAYDDVPDGIYGQFVSVNGKLRNAVIPITTAEEGQYRPDVAAAKNTFLVLWTDLRDTAGTSGKRDVYEYYGRVIGNDVALSSRWRNPQSR